eukprot:TRINITY_DN23342_c0_g1_i1.p5 TRINITY_DN23342_c0_g1~~TRINITY_DN23342_c0_g1_i1.p5  ORF type:complete len:104 (-),score=7.46 TRINITY_DN23342_c0_g1_i1:461-772(-)
MAPEVICHQQHSFGVDFFAIGVILFEAIFRHRPWMGRNRKEIREAICQKQVKVSERDIPKDWSNRAQAASFINKLIERKQEVRLGTKGGVQEVMEHPWMRNFP